jgi:hypothetical protein
VKHKPCRRPLKSRKKAEDLLANDDNLLFLLQKILILHAQRNKNNIVCSQKKPTAGKFLIKTLFLAIRKSTEDWPNQECWAGPGYIKEQKRGRRNQFK